MYIFIHLLFILYNDTEYQKNLIDLYPSHLFSTYNNSHKNKIQIKISKEKKCIMSS